MFLSFGIIQGFVIVLTFDRVLRKTIDSSAVFSSSPFSAAGRSTCIRQLPQLHVCICLHSPSRNSLWKIIAATIAAIVVKLQLRRHWNGDVMHQLLCVLSGKNRNACMCRESACCASTHERFLCWVQCRGAFASACILTLLMFLVGHIACVQDVSMPSKRRHNAVRIAARNDNQVTNSRTNNKYVDRKNFKRGGKILVCWRLSLH